MSMAVCALQGCRFHRIVKGFVCQGGDVVKGGRLPLPPASAFVTGRRHPGPRAIRRTLAAAPELLCRPWN